MIVSMTGFSSATVTLPLIKDEHMEAATPLSLALTLKSLNARFFEANCKLPFILTHLETPLIKKFKSQLHRGSIYFTVYITNQSTALTIIEPVKTVIENYLEAIKFIHTTYGIANTVTMSDLILLPGVFNTKEQPLEEESLTALMQAIDQLLAQLLEARKKEGTSIAQDLHKRINLIRSYLAEIEPRALVLIEERKAHFLQTLPLMATEKNPEGSSELTLLAAQQLDKIDIHEEIFRFKTHLDNLMFCIDSAEEETGKKIDFFLQELFREINTLAAKCSDAIISKHAINIKVELEKAREQAQNIV